MKAVITAGGRGERMRPLTTTTPKALLPVGGRPMIEHVIRLFVRHGIREIVVTVGPGASAIREHLGDGSGCGAAIDYLPEAAGLEGVVPAIAAASEIIAEPFIVAACDVITDFDVGRLVEQHRVTPAALATVALMPVADPWRYAVAEVNSDGRIVRYAEKPSPDRVFSHEVDNSFAVLEPALFDGWRESGLSSFTTEIFPGLVATGEGLYGFRPGAGYFQDAGTFDGYWAVHEAALRGDVQLDVVASERLIGEGTMIADSAIVEGPTVLGPNVTVAGGARIKRCILYEGTVVGAGARLDSVIAGRRTVIGAGARCRQGAVLGDGVVIEDGASVPAEARVAPYTTVAAL